MTATAALTEAVLQAKSGNPLNNPSLHFLRNFNGSLDEADVTAAGAANLSIVDSFSTAASGTNNIDLAAFASVSAIYIRVTSTGAGVLTMGAAATNAFVGPFGTDGSEILKLGAADELMLRNPEGWAVSGTTKTLKIAAATATVTYDVVIVGVAV